MLTQAPPRTQAEVSEHAFQGVLWTLIAVDICFVFTRLVIRWKMFKRLFWDDLCAVVAVAMFLTSAILWKYNLFRVYLLYEASSGKRPFDQSIIDSWDRFLHLIVPFNVLFYSGIWAVKFSLLIFFQKLGNKLRSFEIWWWCVFGITTASYVACIANIQWECTRPARSIMYIMSNCDTLQKIDWVIKTLYANCGMDVGTDLLILSIPVSILWNTAVLIRKKIILVSIFSATVAIMIMAIVRVAVVNSHRQSPEIAWLYFWSNLEVGVAIIISCVASFRQLFVAKHGQYEDASSPPQGHSASWGLSFSKFTKSSSSKQVFLTRKDSVFTHNKNDGFSSQERDRSEDSDVPLHFLTMHNPSQGSMDSSV